jgi:putative membrane protein
MMEEKPYREIPESMLILRDKLAIDRTILANERTFLAYIRTFLTFLITGVGFIKFIDTFAIQILGWIFAIFSVFIGIFGLLRYQKTKKKYKELVSKDEYCQNKRNTP